MNRLIDAGREEEALTRLEALHASLGYDPEMQSALGWDVGELRRLVTHNRLVRRFNAAVGLLNAGQGDAALGVFREVAAADGRPLARRAGAGPRRGDRGGRRAKAAPLRRAGGRAILHAPGLRREVRDGRAGRDDEGRSDGAARPPEARAAAAAAAAGLVTGRLGADQALPSKGPDAQKRPDAGPAAKPGAHPFNPRTAEAMPTRNLGKTGFRVGLFSLGGQAALEKPDERGRRRAAHRAGARPRRELRRHLGPLRGRGALERAVLRAGDGEEEERGVPRHEDARPHARRLAPAPRDVAEAPEDRPRRPLAAPRDEHDGRRREGLREGGRARGVRSRRASRSSSASSASRATPTRPSSPRRSGASRSTRSSSPSTPPTRTTSRSAASSCRSPSRRRWGSSG